MSGHCPVPSRRKEFAQEIGKHMHVDLFTNVALSDISEEPQCPVNAEKNVSRDAADYLPKGTFVNALEFPSAIELAKKLLESGSNEEQYTQFLKGKYNYYDAGKGVVFSEATCQLCNKLGNNYTTNSQHYWTRMLKKVVEDT